MIVSPTPVRMTLQQMSIATRALMLGGCKKHAAEKKIFCASLLAMDCLKGLWLLNVLDPFIDAYTFGLEEVRPEAIIGDRWFVFWVICLGVLVGVSGFHCFQDSDYSNFREFVPIFVSYLVCFCTAWQSMFLHALLFLFEIIWEFLSYLVRCLGYQWKTLDIKVAQRIWGFSTEVSMTFRNRSSQRCGFQADRIFTQPENWREVYDETLTAATVIHDEATL